MLPKRMNTGLSNERAGTLRPADRRQRPPRVQTWTSEHDATADWQDYIHQGRLNQTELATECGFTFSVCRQNPAVKTALEVPEARLLASYLPDD